ncbi:unnamed protein product [Durusdinium trenchii]|uniref:Amine oxidase n=1 Tax=Durusdinium trenchii TaxID=1381693 RepID=A0ABP0NGN3_9DINO
MFPVVAGLLASAGLDASSPAAARRPEGVNRPELLPKTDGASTPVIDVARLHGAVVGEIVDFAAEWILTPSQERELAADIAEIEKTAQVRLRVLTQTFPNTPGLAIKDYWKPDARTVIYVHDTGGLGETAVVNFNAGQEVELMRPVSSQSVERSGDVAVRTGSGSLGPFRLGCGSVWGSFLVRFNGVPRAALLDVSDC